MEAAESTAKLLLPFLSRQILAGCMHPLPGQGLRALLLLQQLRGGRNFEGSTTDTTATVIRASSPYLYSRV